MNDKQVFELEHCDSVSESAIKIYAFLEAAKSEAQKTEHGLQFLEEAFYEVLNTTNTEME